MSDSVNLIFSALFTASLKFAEQALGNIHEGFGNELQLRSSDECKERLKSIT